MGYNLDIFFSKFSAKKSFSISPTFIRPPTTIRTYTNPPTLGPTYPHPNLSLHLTPTHIFGAGGCRGQAITIFFTYFHSKCEKGVSDEEVGMVWSIEGEGRRVENKKFFCWSQI